MNLAETKHLYQQALREHEPNDPAATLKRLEVMRKSAMRAIDQHTTRRFLPVNERRGLVEKLERLHREVLAAMESQS